MQPSSAWLLATCSPYQTDQSNRFGTYIINLQHMPPPSDIECCRAIQSLCVDRVRIVPLVMGSPQVEGRNAPSPGKALLFLLSITAF
jgi:hypothetical protein